MTRPQLFSHWISSGRVLGKPTLLCYPLNSDLSDGRCYPNFEQLEIGCLHTQNIALVLSMNKVKIAGAKCVQFEDAIIQ